LAAVPLVWLGFHGEWNYIKQPAAEKTPPTARQSNTILEA
jgi:hypothetical protein